jgi:outer membrane protein
MGVLLALLPVCVGAAEPPGERPLTVDECVAMALDRNLTLAVAKAGTRGAQGSRLASFAGVLPSVSAGASAGRTHSNNQRSRREYFGTTAEVLSPSYDINSYGYELSAGMSLLNWSSWKRLSASGAQLAEARAAEEAAREGVVYSVRRQYYEYLKAIKLAGVARDAEALSRGQLERTQAMFDLGSVTRGDVLSARVDLVQNELARITAENREQVERSRLATELGLPADAPVRIVEEFGAPTASVRRVPLSEALDGRGDVRQGRHLLAGSRASLSAARGGYLPSLSGSWSYQWSDSRKPELFESFDYNTRWSASLSLNVPIFDGLLTRGEVTRAAAGVRANERSLRDIELQSALEVEEARLAIDQSEKQVVSAAEGVSFAEENHRLRQEMYDVGAATILEVQTALLELTRARVAQIEALAGLRQSEALYSKATGQTP